MHIQVLLKGKDVTHLPQVSEKCVGFVSCKKESDNPVKVFMNHQTNHRNKIGDAGGTVVAARVRFRLRAVI